MLKTLFNIILILVGLGNSVHACDSQLLNSDLEHSVSIETSDEVYSIETSHRLFFDLQTKDFSVVSNVDREPSQSEENTLNNVAILCLSNCFTALQKSQFVRAEHNSFNHFYLKEILFPFHSFW
ncbi:hypothetical protein [uncultured Winogradskyella sp.]|uniref:hypothetical protein n=1 Tax=uncultured Winogradskyella sp. TaxID=395353 RepID=UPI00261596A3|nr:hypothetical protein [uncultured Winogradskyella sp.]|tara:strand:+ start:149 stop:520 length:372 start_codon:yes stop_codon:yes gene_type:complete